MKANLSKGKLLGLKSTDLNFCEDCVYRKQRKVSFSNVKNSSKAERLELVYTDVCDKAYIPSLGGLLYFVIFIDDASRKV